jgi:hypothetical protein
LSLSPEGTITATAIAQLLLSHNPRWGANNNPHSAPSRIFVNTISEVFALSFIRTAWTNAQFNLHGDWQAPNVDAILQEEPITSRLARHSR